MPAAYAHDRFGMDVLSALPQKYREAAAADIDLFRIGVQGPDILYYYKPFSHHPMHEAANEVHRLSGKELFSKYGKIFYSQGPRRSDFSYLCGFMCHFALDRACHGYIRALDEGGNVCHAEIESEFDRFLLEEDGLDPIRTDLSAHFIPSRRAASVITPYFSWLNDDADPQLPPVDGRAILRSIRSFVRFNRLLVMPGRINYRAFDRVLQRFPAYPFMHSHMINIDPDPLCEESNKVLRELYGSTVPEACQLIRDFLPAVRGEKEWDPLMDWNFESMLKRC